MRFRWQLFFMEIEMETNIEIDVNYNKNEIKKAISSFLLLVCNMRTYALITYPILVIVIVLSLIFSDNALLPLSFFFVGVVLFYYYYQRPIHGYLKYYEKRGERLFKFTNDNVLIIGKVVRSECMWTLYKKAHEIPSAFLLLDDNKFVYIFPKSCFSDTLTLEQMRSLLSEKFPNFKAYK